MDVAIFLVSLAEAESQQQQGVVPLGQSDCPGFSDGSVGEACAEHLVDEGRGGDGLLHPQVVDPLHALHRQRPHRGQPASNITLKSRNLKL